MQLTCHNPSKINYLLNRPIKIRFKDNSITITLSNQDNCTKYYKGKCPILLGHLNSKYLIPFFDGDYYFEEVEFAGKFIKMKDILHHDYHSKIKQS